MGKPSLVLIPGTLCDETAWRDQVAGLSDIAVIQVADLRGKDSLTAMAHAILDHAPSSFALAGHSMGGRIALEMVDQAPDRVERLALLDTGTHPVGKAEPARRAAATEIVERGGLDAYVDGWIRAILPDDRQDDAALVAVIRDMILRFRAEDFHAQTAAMLSRRDLFPVLGRIACPTLVLCGADDSYSPPDQHRAMAAAIPDAEVEILDDCGHMAPMERPEAVTRALRRWLTTP